MTLVKKTKKNIKSKIKKESKPLLKKSVKKSKISLKNKDLKKITKKTSVLDLKRSDNNPIIEPDNQIYWESRATFNPSAVYHDGKIHIIYRAVGNSDISVLGYVKSNNGYNILKQSKDLAFYHKNKQIVDKNLTPKITYSSGGGWGGGCEDPRLTLIDIDNKVYMIYTSFDGWSSLRLALTSISLDDFISKRWNWKEPIFISPPGEIHKNWVIFPEKIKGKYAVLHSFFPKILIDYFDNLDELNGKKFIKSNNSRPVDKNRTWDSWFRGVGPSPIKTKYGWLIIYHAMDHKNPDRYRMGAIILDIKNPTKILYRSNEPILEPDEWYENEGYKSGVVYSCGAIVKNNELFVYYGGADKVSCVATANLDKFLEELVNSNAPKLKTKKNKK